jgi:TIR domain
VAHDVFISYSSKDRAVAFAACARLEARGIRCWIAPRDVLAGVPYGEAIIDAIHGAKVMVLVFSSNANTSGHIPKEVERAVSKGVALVPFRIEDVTPGKSLDYFIGSVHWLDAITPPLEQHLEILADSVERLLPARAPAPGGDAFSATLPLGRQMPRPTAAPAASYTPSARAAGAPQSRVWLWAALGVLVIAAISTAVLYFRGDLSSFTSTDGAPAISGGLAPTGNEAVIGCWHWINNMQVVVRRDGTLSYGRFMAQWRVSDPDRQVYTFVWPQPVDTLTLSPDGRSLSGSDQYGTNMFGTRISSGRGIAGRWRWSSGIEVNIDANGSFNAGATNGTWRETDSSRGVYQLLLPTPVDVVTLSANRNQILATGNLRVLGNRMACSGM